MDSSYWRSLVRWVRRRNENPSDSKKVYKRYPLFSKVPKFLPLCVAISFSPVSAAQTQYSKAMEPSSTNSEVSVAELRIPLKALSHLRAADKALRQSSLNQAAKETDRALQFDPACAPAFSMKAFIDLAAKQPLAAVEHATHAIAIDPYGADSYVALAMAYNSAEDFAGGQRAARQALAIRPNSWQARLELVKSLYGEGRFEAALGELNAIGKDFPDVHLVRGNVLMRLGRTGEGAAEFRRFLEEVPYELRSSQPSRVAA